MFMLSIILFAFIFSSLIYSQTNTNVRFNSGDEGGTYKVEWEFKLDSLAGLLSPEFTFPKYDGTDLKTYPITFKRNTVSTYGTPKLDIFLLGAFQTRTDTTALDTVAFQQTGETDSVGILTLSGSNGLIPTRAGSYRFLARSLNADINSGKITLIIPRKETE